MPIQFRVKSCCGNSRLSGFEKYPERAPLVVGIEVHTLKAHVRGVMMPEMGFRNIQTSRRNPEEGKQVWMLVEWLVEAGEAGVGVSQTCLVRYSLLWLTQHEVSFSSLVAQL